MNCDDIRGALAASVDGPPTSGEKALLDAHLAGCAACRETFAAWQRVSASLPPLPLPADSFFQAQRSQILDRIERPRVSAWRWAPLAAAGALVAAALFVVPHRRRVSDPAMMLNLDLIQNLDMAKDLTVLEAMDKGDL